MRDDAAAATGPAATNLSAPIRRAVDWMQRHLAEPYPVAEPAAVARLSVTQFHHRFAAEVGTTPGDWRARQRIRLARERLRTTDHPVTQIAFDLGFASSQYFATTFKRLVGNTPRAYRCKYRNR